LIAHDVLAVALETFGGAGAKMGSWSVDNENMILHNGPGKKDFLDRRTVVARG